MTTVPEISFADTTPEQLVADIIALVEAALGRTLAPADPLGLFARAFAAEDIVLRNLLDEAARQGLLEYATDVNLDALGELVGVERLSAVAATCSVRFSSAAAATADITIPAGTRVAPSGDLYFDTDLAAVLPTGQTYIDVPVTCMTAGTEGNGYTAGQISRIVDPVAGIATVANTTTSADGVDTETDDALRIRIRLAPTAFSVAGPRDAYEFWARSASAAIIDVEIDSPTPGQVDIYVLETGGAIPSAPTLALVEATCSADTVRPLTDSVTAKAPTEVDYTVNLTYYVAQSDSALETSIDDAVEQAVTDWIAWTRAEIGRDVNPSELTARIIEAGAKRVVITTPVYDAIGTTEVGVIDGAAVVTDGGVEAD